jgi:hypothetical protein
MRHKERLSVRSDLVDDSVVLTEDKLELVVVHLELFLLEKDNLGTLRDINSDSGDALGLSDEGKNLLIEVDVELIVLWMSDDQGSLKTSLSVLNLLDPLFSPEVLEGEKSVTDLVVVLESFLGLLLLDQVLRELLNGARDSEEQMSGPGDGTGHGWQVTDNWRVVLVAVVLLFDLGDLSAVVLEQQVVLGVKAVSEVVSVKDSLELSKKLK